MIFSSIPFLYYFLPIIALVYFIVPNTHKHLWRNLALLCASLFFYAWGEPKNVFLMLGSTLIGYVFGLIIGKFKKGTPMSKLLLSLAVGANVAVLGVFKYADFAVGGVNSIFGTSLSLPGIALPVGISFYTFQILSYCVDVYRRDVPPQKNFIDFASYVTMFPQLIAGPIVRYSDIATQLTCRTHSTEKVYHGMQRFIIGLSKKVLIANQLGELCDIYKKSSENSLLFVWLYAIAFALHVYFDFSGYSDMAIGLGKLFGFEFVENFNYPFISKSATEFWRRWHMSLGTWFRDYVYIPMGGNRVNFARRLLNIFTVWALTGLWHGASMNFVVWGLFYAVLLVIEKFFLLKVLEKMPKFISHIYLIITVVISFIIFDAHELSLAGERIASLVGVGTSSLFGAESLYYLRSYAPVLLIAIVGSMPVAKLYRKRVPENHHIETALCAILLIVVTAYLVDGSYNPFLYFRF